MRRGKGAIWVALLAMAVMLAGCGAGEARPFDYRTRDFEARIEGNRQGSGFSCVVVSVGGELREVRYTAPEALEGLTLTHATDGWRMRFREHETNFDSDALEGLLLPGRLLLVGGDPRLVLESRKTANGWLIRVMGEGSVGEAELTLGADGAPVAVVCGSLSVRVASIQFHS